MYYSFIQWNFIEWNKPWFFLNFFWVILRLLINPFFSWIMVFIRLYWFISLINQKISTPEKLKEIQYKLWASLLKEDEVKKLIKESASFMWENIVFEDEEEYEVKDWVILKSEIQKKYNDSEISPLIWNYDEKINELDKEINWNTNYNYKIKYYILSKHPEILPQNEFRKIIRKELERVKLWFMKVSDFCKDYDIELLYNNEDKYYQFKYKNEEKNDNINYTDFSNKLESAFLDAECKRFEIENYNEILDTINSYL